MITPHINTRLRPPIPNPVLHSKEPIRITLTRSILQIVDMRRDSRGHAHATHPRNAPEGLRVDLVDVAAGAALGSGMAARC